MMEMENKEAARVSDRIGGIARVSSTGALPELKSAEQVTIEVNVNGQVQRLTIAAASQVAAALNGAVDHVRRENPVLMADHAPSTTEIELVSNALHWARVLQQEGRSLDTVSHSGIERSLLLRRIRSGRTPMKAPPPTSFGQPWYDVLECDDAKIHTVTTDGKLTTLAELLGTMDASATARNQFLIQLNGCHWNVLKTVEFGKRFVVSYQGHAQMFALALDADGSWLMRKFTPQVA